VIEDTMFFPKLRRNAKWVFLFLALVFGLGFIGFGVGAGGVGIGDVFRGAAGDSGVPALDDARERVNENPKDPQAFRDLATAAQTEQQTDEAIEALEGYIALKPRDTDALRELAGLYLVQVDEARQEYQIAELRSAYLGTGAAVFQTINLGGRPLDPDPISNAVSTFYSVDVQNALGKAQQASSSSVATYKKIAALTPKDPNVQLELAEAARNAADTPTAIAAYKKYLALVPANDPTAREVKRVIKELSAGTPG
jgi:regulator of sirC expression with transglutaminase-like and TPR domain